ncbi:toxin glutamine deamidase domain-containing protein [Paractinoplanes toevensis]|uniref:Tox-PL domain-containing protein n=1 Tax=Paractinoplanes toevensis TaxID=571911 RepID=A0A919W8V4_9ACTN|nr:toxin glutamine deamidase domain-containing protein [Actinoplanes toevensis]GIM95732.1 hypothetical protein Ato02nite_075250 [Actinoplanes toevensis]
MTILPSPIPHPLDYSPWDLPGWAYDALEWVVGFDWPEGNEKVTWDIADQWYDLVSAMAAPRDDAAEAAQRIIDAYGGSGTTIEAFIAAWQKVADGDEAPLNALIEFANEMAKMVEGCGRDIEGAKLEAWIELGIFVIELIGMAVTVALTLGAASPAAGGLIAATRMAIQQIFKKLIAQLAKKAIKQGLKDMGKRVAKDILTKKGLKQLGKKALKEGREEAREEFLTNLGVQTYQNMTGRADGISLSDLAWSTGAGAAGGAAAHGANIGAGHRSGIFRGAAAEVLGDLGGSAATGNLSDFESLAKSATSGVSGTAVGNTHHDFKGMSASLVGAGDLTLSDLPSAPSAVSNSSGTDVSTAISDLSSGSTVTSTSSSPTSSPAVATSASVSTPASVSTSASVSTPASVSAPASASASASVSAPSLAADGSGTSTASSVTSPSVSHAQTSASASAPAADFTSSNSAGSATLAAAAPAVDATAHTSVSASTPVSTSASTQTSGPVAFAQNAGPGVAAGPVSTGASVTTGGSPSSNVSLAGGSPSPSSLSTSTSSPAVTGPATSVSATSSPSPSVSTTSSPSPTATSPQSLDTGGTRSGGSTISSTTGVSTSGPTVSAPSATSPNIAGSSAPGPNITGSSVTSPSITGPSVTSPSVTSPSVAGPNVTSPSVSNPSVAGPNVTSPSGAGPNVDGSPSPSGPGPSSPNANGPSGNDPSRPRNEAPVAAAGTTTAPETTSPTRPAPGPADPGRPGPVTPDAATGPSTSAPAQPGRPDTPSPDRPRSDGDRTDPAVFVARSGHANPHLTSRTPEQARFEQAYFDQQAQNKQIVLSRISTSALRRHERAIAALERAQADARREARKAKFTFQFRKADRFRALEAAYQQQETDAVRRRDQVKAYLAGQQFSLVDTTKPYFDPVDFATANTDRGYLSGAPIWSNDHSALTGGPNPPNSRTLRNYNSPGGLRRPLAMHQADLEQVVPRDQNGAPVRTPDPRGPLLKLLNDGGSVADPTRGFNCLDCALSFFETYFHGRPTVSAPRTVDNYRYGADVHAGETSGTNRAEVATGSGFTYVTPSDPTKPHADVKADIDRGFEALARTLLQGGHGSTAVIVTEWENGSAHAWNAVNHNGAVLFLDPQSGECRDATNFTGGPGHRTLYGHTGAPNGANAVGIHALMVDGQGNPMAVPNTAPSPYSGRTTPPPPPLAYQQQQALLQQQANQQATPPQPPAPPAPPVNLQPPAPPVVTPSPAPPVNPQPPAPPVNPPPPDPPVDSRQPETPTTRQPTVDTQAEATVRPHATEIDPPVSRDGFPTRTDESASPTTTQPTPKRPDFDLLSVLDPDSTSGSANRDPLSALDPAPRDTAADSRIELTTEPTPDADARQAAEHQAKADYHFATDRARREFDESHRQQLAEDLRIQAATVNDQARNLNKRVRDADQRGDYAEADRHAADRDRMAEEGRDLEDRASGVERGGEIGDVELTGNDWEQVNENHGGSDLAPGPVETGDRSALTGDIGPRSIDTTRRYNQRGGLRPPLRIHQTDLERAMPRDTDGNPIRHADPRTGEWFDLVNDGGPEADPTRSINCGDTVLSLYDSYMHGRPRVSAPRTFDGYHNGDPSRPMDAERGVTARIENTTGARFEGLTDVSSLDPQDQRAEVRLAESRLHNHLLGLGHGSFAFVTTQDQAGRTHAIAAINQNGTILYLDAQNRTISATSPLRTNTGQGYPSDVVRMDALVVDGQARPRPLTTSEGPFVTAEPAGGPNPDVYDGAQRADMHRHGEQLGLAPEQIDDFITAGSIEKDPNPPKRPDGKAALTPDEVKQQMDNWTGDVEPRGYPHHFQSRDQFLEFVDRLHGLTEAFGIPNGRVVVQGSSLRTPNAGDVDFAVIVSDEDFDAYAARCGRGIEARANPRAVDGLLSALAGNVSSGFVSKYYADRPDPTAPTFSQQVISLAREFSVPAIDFSVMKESSVMMMYPWMDVTVGRA